MSSSPLSDLFDHRITFPNTDARGRLARLVGLDEEKERLIKMLSILIDQDGLDKWASSSPGPIVKLLLEFVKRRPPLIILAGDVGTGKTELAETIGDGVSRQLGGLSIILFPLSLSTRGSGHVGEMTKLISAAFDEAHNEAQKRKNSKGKATGGVILLIDEADALAQSREASQMHHEDKAGVNALIRGADRLAKEKLPAAVIMCTNRLSALDPAVQRRAAELIIFSRPNDEQRRVVISDPLLEVGFSREQLEEIVEATGAGNEGGVGFTYSDITQRFLPSLVIDAYPDKPITFERAMELLNQIRPTPPFVE